MVRRDFCGRRRKSWRTNGRDAGLRSRMYSTHWHTHGWSFKSIVLTISYHFGAQLSPSTSQAPFIRQVKKSVIQDLILTICRRTYTTGSIAGWFSSVYTMLGKLVYAYGMPLSTAISRYSRRQIDILQTEEGPGGANLLLAVSVSCYQLRHPDGVNHIHTYAQHSGFPFPTPALPVPREALA